MMQRGKEIYKGKAKTLYETSNKDFLIVEFRDDTSAFDGIKVEQLSHKGKINNYVNAFIMEKLKTAGIAVHHEKILGEQDSLVKHLQMIPVECVVRNISAGSLCRRLGVEEGITLNPPTFELFLKNDALHDPMLNESLVETFGWAKPKHLAEMKRISFEVNMILKQLFLDADLLLVDYKLEFGLFNEQIVLGDEFTPDGCRIWDKTTRKKLDKDRFRKDLGNVIQAYLEVADRLKIEIPF